MPCPGGSSCLHFISSGLSGDSCFSMVHAGIDKSGFTLKKWGSLAQNMLCTLLSLSLKSCFCKNCIFLIHTWLMHFVYWNMCTRPKLIYLEILGKLIPPCSYMQHNSVCGQCAQHQSCSHQLVLITLLRCQFRY